MGYFVGAISGTSIDGLDLAIIDVGVDTVTIEHATTVPFPKHLHANLVGLTTNTAEDLVLLGRTHAELGSFIGAQIACFVSELGFTTRDIVAIGSHGQTICHAPDGQFNFSHQIGDASRIAAVTGIDTVADFRSADIASGGQGAPLVPVLHDRIFRSKHTARSIVNIGGICNVTFLPMDLKQSILGFDTGPGNALLDAWTLHEFDCRYDHKGEFARSGAVIDELLAEFLDDSWLSVPPPKSTGKEYFNLQYIQHKIRATTVNTKPINVLTTLTEFTALTLSRAIKQWCCTSGEVIACGGGRLNEFLMHRLEHHLSNHAVRLCDDLGINGDAVEAATFGYLAYLFVNKEPGNIPTVTGANRERVLGCLYPA